MIIPYEEALQELWVSHRVDQYQREHRPHPDYSLFIAEFKTAIERIKADAWDEGKEDAMRGLDIHGDTDAENPYREVNDD